MSAGVQNNNWVQYASSCPASTTNDKTISNDYQSGAFYLDTALSFDFEGPYSSQDQLFFNIPNIMNRSPAIVTNGLSGSDMSLQTTPVLYDVWDTHTVWASGLASKSASALRRTRASYSKGRSRAGSVR